MSHHQNRSSQAPCRLGSSLPQHPAAPLTMTALHRSADPVMPGVLRFSSLTAALHAGFQVCGHTAGGYLVKLKTTRGWGLAIATVSEGAC